MSDMVMDPFLFRIILLIVAGLAVAIATLITACSMIGRKDSGVLDGPKMWAATFGVVCGAGLFIAAVLRWAQPVAEFLTGLGA